MAGDGALRTFHGYVTDFGKTRLFNIKTMKRPDMLQRKFASKLVANEIFCFVIENTTWVQVIKGFPRRISKSGVLKIVAESTCRALLK